MKIASIAARLFLGTVFLVFGLNAFLHFIPIPPMGDEATRVLGALFGSGWLFVVKIFETSMGTLLIASIFLKRFAPLALVFLTPVSFNIFVFHALLARDGLPVSGLILALALFLLYVYRAAFAGIFKEHE